MIDLSTVGVFLYFLYPVTLISISMYVSHNREVTLESYFFADRNSHWFVLGVSLLTACIFSPYIFGLAISGSTLGLTLIYVIVSTLMLILLGWYIVPKFLKNKIDTLPDYFEKRFNRSCRVFLSALYIICNVFIRLITILAIGSIFINIVAGVDAYSSLLFFLVITSVYVIIGGLQTEIYVNLVQVLFIVLGVIGFAVWLIKQSDGINLGTNRITSILAYEGRTNQDFTPTELIIGLPIIGFWFWCADQFVVQKVLSIRNINVAKKAISASWILQVIIVPVCILSAIALITLSFGGTPKETLRTLFTGNLLPESLRAGFIIAVAAAMMASLSGLFNSTSSLVTLDFYRKFKPTSSDRKLVLVGRLTTLVLLFCSILLLPTAQSMDFSLCLKLFKVLSYFSAMIAAVFFISLINQNINATSALMTLITGTIVILLRTSLEFLKYRPLENTLLGWFVQSGFLEFSIFIFALSVLLMYLINRLKFVRHKVRLPKQIPEKFNLKSKFIHGLYKRVFIFLSVIIIIFAWLIFV